MIMLYECEDCCHVQRTSKCELCGHEALRMLKLFRKGDIVVDDDGRVLEITSGNYENAENGSVYDLSVNVHYVRAREANAQPTTILEMIDGVQDFIWYERRIVGLKEEVYGTQKVATV